MQSHDAFHRAQARAGAPKAGGGDVYEAAAAEAQLRRAVRETVREVGEAAAGCRAAEERAAAAAEEPPPSAVSLGRCTRGIEWMDGWRKGERERERGRG